MGFTLRAIVVLSVLQATFPSQSVARDCRPHILKATCFTTVETQYDHSKSSFENLKAENNPDCEPTKTQLYAKRIAEIYPELPEHVQSAFCSIRQIVILPDPPFAGEASIYYDDTKARKPRIDEIIDSDPEGYVGVQPGGYRIRLSEKWRLTNPETISEMRNRRLREMFDIKSPRAWDERNLPKFSYINDIERSALYSTLVHEIGHLFFESLKSHEHALNLAGKLPHRQYWENLSWRPSGMGNYSPQDSTSAKFSGIYNQKIILPLTEVPVVFDQFEKAPYSSFYAFSSPEEDFAEHYTYLMMKGELILHRGTDHPFRISDKETLPIFKAKSDFIRSRLSYGFTGYRAWMPTMWISTKPEQPRTP